MATSYIPLVEPATEDNLKTIATNLKLGLSDEQLKDYLVFVNATLKNFNGMRNIKEETIPVLYPRIPGVKPSKPENPDNAWASKMTINGESTGLLAGKRIAIKDNIFLAGTPMQNGSKIFDGYTPEFDATVVTRILQAGGTIIGKSTCENHTFSGNSFTSACGPVPNPHDGSRTSGGSSSGSAVLVVKGEVDMAMGGDNAGSIRIPACWSGCVGLKPTFGLVPVTGSFGMVPCVEHLGPMATNVRDVAVLLEAIAGYDDGRDHRQSENFVPPKYSELLTGDLKNMRFGCVQEGLENATEGVKSALQNISQRMRESGAIVEDISIPLHKQGLTLFKVLVTSSYNSMVINNGQATGYKEFYQVSAAKYMSMALKTQAHDIQPSVKASMLLGEYVRQKDGNQLIVRAMNMFPTLRKAYDEALKKYDVLIMPTMPSVAPKLPKHELKATEFIKEALVNVQNTVPFNLTGHPCLSLNIGTAKPEDGESVKLPVGLQITGRHFEDDKVLDMSFGIEKVRDMNK